jgi:hypothetical protein
LDFQLSMQSVPIATNFVNADPTDCKVYWNIVEVVPNTIANDPNGFYTK